MKSIFTLLTCCFFALAGFGQTSPTKQPVADTTKAMQVVEVSCGKCKLGLAGNTCDMAVRIDGKAYYADGANIDAFGDAHQIKKGILAVRQNVNNRVADADNLVAGHVVFPW